MRRDNPGHLSGFLGSAYINNRISYMTSRKESEAIFWTRSKGGHHSLSVYSDLQERLVGIRGHLQTMCGLYVLTPSSTPCGRSCQFQVPPLQLFLQRRRKIELSIPISLRLQQYCHGSVALNSYNDIFYVIHKPCIIAFKLY